MQQGRKASLWLADATNQVVGAQLPRPYTRTWIHADALRTGGPQARR